MAEKHVQMFLPPFFCQPFEHGKAAACVGVAVVAWRRMSCRMRGRPGLCGSRSQPDALIGEAVTLNDVLLSL